MAMMLSETREDSVYSSSLGFQNEFGEVRDDSENLYRISGTKLLACSGIRNSSRIRDVLPYPE